MSNKAVFKATDKLMSYLAKRDHSELELREKLSRKFTSEEIDQAITSAKENNWLPSPEELTERVVLRLNEKKKGFLYISQYLKKKGLPPTERDFELECQKASDILSQFNTDLPRDSKARKLIYRGFEQETILRVINNR